MSEESNPSTPDPDLVAAVRQSAAVAAAARLSMEAAIAQAREAGASLRLVSGAAGISHEQVRRLHAGYQQFLAGQLDRQIADLRKLFLDPAFQRVVQNAADGARQAFEQFNESVAARASKQFSEIAASAARTRKRQPLLKGSGPSDGDAG